MKKVKKTSSLVMKMNHSMELIDMKTSLSSNLKGGDYLANGTCFSQSVSNLAEC